VLTSELVMYAAAALAGFLFNKWRGGQPILPPVGPSLPVPNSQPVPQPVPTPGTSQLGGLLSMLLEMLLRVKSSNVKLDDHSREVAKTLQPLIQEVATQK
jgi:hypothetical protein